MPKFLATTCPHCKGEFEKKVLDLICGGVKYSSDEYNVSSEGTYTRKTPHLQRCPLCDHLMNEEDWKQVKQRYRYEDDPKPIQTKWQNFKWWSKRFLP